MKNFLSGQPFIRMSLSENLRVGRDNSTSRFNGSMFFVPCKVTFLSRFISAVNALFLSFRIQYHLLLWFCFTNFVLSQLRSMTVIFTSASTYQDGTLIEPCNFLLRMEKQIS